MRRHLIFIAVLPLLASCALGPKVAKPNLTLPTAYESQPTAGPSTTSIDRWWALYNDPQLETLVDQALLNAPDARSALARLRQAKAARSDALSDFWPQGALKGTATRTDTLPIGSSPSFSLGPGTPPISLSNAGVTDSYGVNFDVTWELDVLGGQAVARKRANADLAAAKFDFDASRTTLAASVADQLFQARGLAVQLDDAKVAARLSKDLQTVAQKKADHGLGAQSDADQASAETAQADAQVADLETQIHAAQRTLLVLVGRGAEPVSNLPISDEMIGTPPTIPASVPGQLLARRPDVREAAAQLVSAKGVLKLDDALPPVRRLATELRINPNTVARAYQNLERDGILRTVPGGGCYVNGQSPGLLKSEKLRRLKPLATQLAVEAKQLRLGREDLVQLLENSYDELNAKEPGEA